METVGLSDTYLLLVDDMPLLLSKKKSVLGLGSGLHLFLKRENMSGVEIGN